jgi:hypothetical protein
MLLISVNLKSQDLKLKHQIASQVMRETLEEFDVKAEKMTFYSQKPVLPKKFSDNDTISLMDPETYETSSFSGTEWNAREMKKYEKEAELWEKSGKHSKKVVFMAGFNETSTRSWLESKPREINTDRWETICKADSVIWDLDAMKIKNYVLVKAERQNYDAFKYDSYGHFYFSNIIFNKAQDEAILVYNFYYYDKTVPSEENLPQAQVILRYLELKKEKDEWKILKTINFDRE